MAVFPKKVDVERLFRRLVPGAAGSVHAAKRPTSGQPGSWRVVTPDGSTAVGSLANRRGGKLLGEPRAEVVLRHDRAGGRPTTIKLVGSGGQHVSLAELELVDTEAPPPEPAKRDLLSEPPSPAPPAGMKVVMPRAKPLLNEALAGDAILEIRRPATRAARSAARRGPRAKNNLFSIRPAQAPAVPAVDANGIDLDLVRVSEAWPTLPSRVRDAVLALVNAAG